MSRTQPGPVAPLALATRLVLLAGLAGCASVPLVRQAADLNTRGARQLAAGDLVGAEASLRVALEYNPRFAEPHNNLGLVALARGDLPVACDHFERAVALNPDFAEAWSNLGVARLRQTDGSHPNGRLPAAREALEAALAIHPGLAPARTNLVRVHLLARDLPPALDHARRLVQVADDDPTAHALHAEAALAAGAQAEAVEAIERGLSLAPDDPRVAIVAARVDLVAGHLDAALDRLDALVGDARVAVEAHLWRAAALLAGGDVAGARADLDAAGPSVLGHPAARVVRAALARAEGVGAARSN